MAREGGLVGIRRTVQGVAKCVRRYVLGLIKGLRFEGWYIYPPGMYTYVYIYMYTYICIYIYMSLHIWGLRDTSYRDIHTHMKIYIYIYTYIYIYIYYVLYRYGRFKGLGMHIYI